MTFGPAAKYLINFALRTQHQEGWRAASLTTARLVFAEAIKIPRLARLKIRSDTPFVRRSDVDLMPPDVVRRVVDAVEHLHIEVRRFSLDPEELARHTARFRYPRFYAGGCVAKGGVREKKILEYFVSLCLVDITATDVVIDVASERSIFPELVRKLTGASVLCQDLIYRPGIHEDRIGGSAANMPVGPGFASKLILHNSFEHFEGAVDTEFVREAWRVLKPGGAVCIVPLFLSDAHTILMDPLVDGKNVHIDSEARVLSVVGFRNRFGRFYSPLTLHRRVIEPAKQCGFVPVVYYFENIRSLDATSGLHFGLVLHKPERAVPTVRRSGDREATDMVSDEG